MTDSKLTQSVLDSLNVEQARAENRKALESLGGTDALIKMIGVNLSTGLTHKQVEDLRARFGNNEYPETPLDSYLALLFEALTDGTLMILIGAATVSLIIGVLTHPDDGWIEGSAIFIAIFLVSNISAGNDYSKQLQFRALEHSSADDERCSVLREGNIERINPRDLVVGDVLVLQAGDMIPADSIMLDHFNVLSNESSLTGEPDDLKKNANHDCFLLSSCLITEGEDCKGLVIGIGTHSQWGKIKANLVTESVNTPLQDKLEDMATNIGKVGMCFAVATFIAEIISIWARPGSTTIVEGIINAFIIAVTIVVVAIPEGLPLAVTIALAYSTKKMYQDQCLIRVLAACETMGNATNICSDKTGTLTENRMTVVEGWFANTIFNQDEFQRASLMESVKRMIAEHVSCNRSAYLVRVDQEGHKLERPTIIGNKTEGALIMMIQNWGFTYEEVHQETFHPETDRVFSFNSAKKRSTAVVQQKDGTVRIFCKGASEWILKDCTHFTDKNGSVAPLTADKREALERHILSMAENALRTLCLAHKDYKSAAALPQGWDENPPDNTELILDCIVGIIDPLREDVKEAVRIAQQAGVTVRMVTGDNIATASLSTVFIAAVAGVAVPLNAVQLLWINLVMDTMGALAKGSEMPTPALLERKPYKRSASLISRPMLRNMLCESAFQLILILILLFAGPGLFGVPPSTYCDEYDVKRSSTMWDLTTNLKSPTGQFTCSDFNKYCKNKGQHCYENTIINNFQYNNTIYNNIIMKDLDDYDGTCFSMCLKENRELTSIIFNTFIFCTLFNEYTMRNLLDEWNPFEGVWSNNIFLGVTIVTIGTQIFLIEVGGDFVKTTSLTPIQWLITVALGAIGLPVGMLMRLIPVKEDPNSFFDNSKDTLELIPPKGEGEYALLKQGDGAV
eukprot:gene7392-7974_t